MTKETNQTTQPKETDQTNSRTRIETFSLLAGTEACNARCPFCVSKMTPPQGMTLKDPGIDWVKFERAFQYAKEGDAQTAMITGKGEPTLFPQHISDYLTNLGENERRHNFTIPTKELQTNGIYIARKPETFKPLLDKWAKDGLETVSVSIVHFDPEKNRQVYLPHNSSYIDLPSLIKTLHDSGLRARLACVLVGGFIDNSEKLEQLIEFARKNKVEELTVRPVNKPEETRNDGISIWVAENGLEPDQFHEIHQYLDRHGALVKALPFGSIIYDVAGQNVCLANSLTTDTDDSYHRQLIFFPNGTIALDWTQDAITLE